MSEKINLLTRFKGKERALAKRARPLVEVMIAEGVRELTIRLDESNISIEMKAAGGQVSSAEDILQFLESKVVNVRQPLVHGSADLFWSSPKEVDGATELSTLRADCLKQINIEKASPNGAHAA